MDKNKITERIAAEEMKLHSLLEKKAKIEEEIKKKQTSIDNFKKMLSLKKFDETTEVISSSGLTLDEIMDALKQGDLLSLQEKLDENKTQEQ